MSTYGQRFLVALLLSFGLVTVNGQVFFEDDPPPSPSRPQNQNPNQNINPNQRQQFPGLNGINNAINGIGSLVNQFLNPFQPGNRRPNTTPPPDFGDNGCQTFRNEPGNCVRLASCDSLNIVLNSVPPFNANRILRRSICGFSGFGPLVCCPFTNNGNNGGNNGNNNGGGNGNQGNNNNGNNNGGIHGGNGGGLIPVVTPAPVPTTRRPLPPVATTTTTTTTTTTQSPFGNGGPATLFPPKPKPSTTPAPAPVPLQDTPYTIPGTNLECGFSNASHQRIIGGHDADKGAWPWMAALGYRDSETGGVSFLCGGALVSEQHVVTASHCVHNRNDLAIVRLGDLNLFSDEDGLTPLDVPIAEAIKHPNYNPTTFQNDIAVLRLREKVPLSRAIHPICLPSSVQHRSELFEGKSPFVAGWGAVQFNGPSSVTLREVQLPVVENSICQEKYKPFKSSHVDDTNICAGFQRGGKDACQGDSGGPLMQPVTGSRWILIGVVSYGFRCAEPGFPGVYSRVTSHVDWLINTITKTS